MQVIIIGGGPAGMLAAISSARNGNKVTILEKMDMLGKKILVTGKGRCNITSSLPIDDFIKNIPGNGMFMYSSFSNFDNQDILNILKNEGVETKIERGNRIFPVSDKADDVRKALIRVVKKLGVNIILNAKVKEILVKEEEDFILKEKEQKDISLKKECDEVKNKKMDGDNNTKNNIIDKIGKKVYGVRAIINGKEETILADKVILATGGKSYPGTGSTGDGYELAQNVGHSITKIRPSLVPLTVKDNISLKLCQKMQGLSLRNVSIKFIDTNNNKVIYEDFGEMLFTHFGVSGPVILSASAHLLRYKNIDELLKAGKIILSIDLKPALSKEKLDERVLRDFKEEKNKEFKNSLDKLLPKKMIDVVIQLSEINPEKRVNEITKSERENLVKVLKELEIEISGFRPIEEAIITSGGINIKEINPKTMESKLIHGLFFAGEIIDVDAYTGGFNLQIAYSTGYTAGLDN